MTPAAAAVLAGVVVVGLLVAAERRRCRALDRARQTREAERAAARAAAVRDVARSTQAWLTALSDSGRVPAPEDCVVSLWEWTCAGCRLACEPVPTRDEAAFLAGEHDRVHHGRRPSAHVHRIARLVFPLDPDSTPEVTPWPDAA